MVKTIKMEVEENGMSIETDKTLQECVDSIVKRENFLTYKVIKKPVTLKGCGYLSVLHTVDINGETSESKKEINLFIKTIVPDDSLGSFLSLSNVFSNECFVYTELAKVFKQLQDEANVPDEERLNMLKGYDETNSKMTVLDNAMVRGFKIRDRMAVAPLHFVKKCMEQLARIHGLGYVLKKRMPEYFEKKILPLKYPYKSSESWVKFAKNMVRITTKNLRLELKEKIDAFVPTFISKYEWYLNNRTSLYTLCHGDFRPNNILMKEKNGVVTEVIPIDYQIMFCGCPAIDFLFFFYGYTDRDFRRQHFTSMIDLYFESLIKFLKYFDIDVNKVSPREQFDVVFKEKEALGLMFAMYFYPSFYVPEGEVPSISEDLSTVDVTMATEIEKRFEEIAEEYIELGIL